MSPAGAQWHGNRRGRAGWIGCVIVGRRRRAWRHRAYCSCCIRGCRRSAVVGTDLAHAVPLTLAAGIGHWWLGHIDWTPLGTLLLGSLPDPHRQPLRAAHPRRSTSPGAGRHARPGRGETDCQCDGPPVRQNNPGLRDHLAQPRALGGNERIEFFRRIPIGTAPVRRIRSLVSGRCAHDFGVQQLHDGGWCPGRDGDPPRLRDFVTGHRFRNCRQIGQPGISCAPVAASARTPPLVMCAPAAIGDVIMICAEPAIDIEQRRRGACTVRASA